MAELRQRAARALEASQLSSLLEVWIDWRQAWLLGGAVRGLRLRSRLEWQVDAMWRLYTRAFQLSVERRGLHRLRAARLAGGWAGLLRAKTSRARQAVRVGFALRRWYTQQLSRAAASWKEWHLARSRRHRFVLSVLQRMKSEV